LLHNRRADIQVSANLQHPNTLGKLVADGLFRRRVCAGAPAGLLLFVTPVAFTRATPARMRSVIIARSNSANTPLI
jgi:hypothetical protein